MNKYMTTLLIGAGVSGVAAIALADDTSSTEGNKAFIFESIQGSLAEQQLGSLAQSKAASDGVRTLAKTLKKDHAMANRKAVQVAKALGVIPPTEPNAEQVQTYDRLAKLSGKEFDSEFVKTLVDDHRKDVSIYESHKDQGSAAVTKYASEVLPNLQQHLEAAERLQSSALTSKR